MPPIATSWHAKPVGHVMSSQSRAQARSPSGYVTHLSIPISVHSESAVHGVHSWSEVGTQTNVTSPSITTPSTPRQP